MAHTVLPATRQRSHSCHYRSKAILDGCKAELTKQRQGSAYCIVLGNGHLWLTLHLRCNMTFCILYSCDIYNVFIFFTIFIIKNVSKSMNQNCISIVFLHRLLHYLQWMDNATWQNYNTGSSVRNTVRRKLCCLH